MDILLINPDVNKYNSLSLGYIAAYLRSRDYVADIVDLSCNISSGTLLNILNMQNPLMVGIAAYQSTMKQVISLAKFIKSNSKAKIVLGGPQVPGIPENSLLELDDVDYFCRGEAEFTMTALINAIQNGKDLDSVPGISFKLPDGSIKTTQNPRLVKDLDEYPSPYLTDVLPPKQFGPTHILTSRGCSSKCSFCITPSLNHGKYRIHSVDRVADEIQYLNKQKGVKYFWIADPDFMGNMNRVRLILEEIVRYNINADFWCQISLKNLKIDVLKLMKKAGFNTIAIGVETINQQALAAMRKDQTAEDIENVIEMTGKMGIKLELFHIIGCPGDTYGSILDTFDFIRSHGFFFEGNNIGQLFNLYFGAEVTRHPERFGISISEKIKRKQYPSFLSPGTHFATNSLSEAEKKKIIIRWESEIDLAELRKTVLAFKSHGIRTQKIVKLPVVTINTVRALLKNDFSSRNDQNGNLDSLMIIDKGGLDEDYSKKIAILIDQLNYSFSLKLISSKDRISFLNLIVKYIIEKLDKYELYDSRIFFNFTLSDWQKNHSALDGFLQNFIARDVPYGETESIDHPITKLFSLLDLSNIDSLSFDQLHEVQNELGKYHAKMFPFVHFDKKSSFENYIDLNKSLYKANENFYEDMVFLGIVKEKYYPDLIDLYQKGNIRSPLAPLHIIDKLTLISGEKPIPPNSQERFCSRTIHAGKD